MDVLDTIEARRSTRHFDPEHRMSAAEFDALMHYVRCAPTAFNIQNWRFVAVQDTELRAEIRQAAWNQPQITEASLLLVLCLDLKSWAKSPHHYWRNAPPHVAESMVRQIEHFYRDDAQLQRDEGMRSCGIAAQTAMLAAKGLGYDSCAMDGFDFKRVAHLINLPPDHRISLIVTIGKAVNPPYPRSGPVANADVVFRDTFPDV